MTGLGPLAMSVGCDESVPSEDPDVVEADGGSEVVRDLGGEDHGPDIPDVLDDDVQDIDDEQVLGIDTPLDGRDPEDMLPDAGASDAPTPDADAVPDADAGCAEVCDPLRPTRCDGDTVETCRDDVDGCASWSRAEDCSLEGLPCVDGEDGAFCLEPGCSDEIANGDETDVDCGGPDCEPCENGLVCVDLSDCLSGVCDEGLCAAPVCGDGIVNAEGEQCDDGNDVDDDSCANDCTLNGCDGCGLTFSASTDSVMAGNASGGIRFDDACPDGQVLIGVHGQVSAWIRRLGVLCGTPNVVIDEDGARIAIENGFEGPERGLHTGTVASSRCPADHAMRSFGARAGALVDQLSPLCVTWTVEASDDGFRLVESSAVPAPVIGGSGGDPRPDVSCPAGQIAVGGLIRAGDSVDAFGIMCATPGVAVP